MLKWLRRRWQLVLFWSVMLYALRGQVHVGLNNLPVDPAIVSYNVDLLRHHKKPHVLSHYVEETVDLQLAEWQLSGPIKIALPPMYSNTAFGNAGFLTSFVNHGEVLFYNGPFPHPKLAISEHIAGASSFSAYEMENRSSNAALYLSIDGYPWPLGYTAWYDLVMATRSVSVKSPRLIDASGHPMSPISVRVVHPLNKVTLGGTYTYIEMHHLSPVIWTFPSDGKLEDPNGGFARESALDAVEVSWMPSLPLPTEVPWGAFLLEQLVQPSDPRAPEWWTLDERFRRAVVDGRPATETRALLEKLVVAHPQHPLLAHYRVIADLGDARFDQTWLTAQKASCDFSTWYLVAWTHLPWSTVRTLPCMKQVNTFPVPEQRAYLAESVVIAFRNEQNNAELRDLAERAVQAGYLRKEFRGFNYPPNDFAWLWLKAHR